MNRNNKNTNKKNSASPALHPFLVIFGAVVIAMILTFVVPLGRYDVMDVTYMLDGQPYESRIVDSNSFRYVLDEDGQKVVYPAPIFGKSGEQSLGMMNVLFAGLSNSTESAGTVGLIAYLLVIGGSFGIVLRTGVIDHGLLRISKRFDDYVMLFPPCLFFLFSLTGALFGFTEYVIPLGLLVIPLMIMMNFDAVTGVLCSFGASQLGAAFCWSSADTLVMAQTLSGVPIMSGASLRIIFWVITTFLCIIYVTRRAWLIHVGDMQSISHKSDTRLRGRYKNLIDQKTPYGVGSQLVNITVLMCMMLVLWGIFTKGYGLLEIASLCFTMAIICGAIGSFYHLNGMTTADIPRAFQSGANDFLGAVLVVGIAQGLILLLGGINPTNATVLNTLLHWTSKALTLLPSMVVAWGMYLFHFIFSFIVPSVSGQAGLSIPVMAPLAETLGISRQLAILAFQIGSGLSHLVMPTSGCLIAILGMAHISWSEWLRSEWKFILSLALWGVILLGIAVFFGYS